MANIPTFPSTTGFPGAGSGGGSGSLDAWSALQFTRAQAALPNASIDSIHVYDFEDNARVAVSGANPPAWQTSPTEDGGILEFAGPGAGTVRPANNIRSISNQKTRKWYMACRIKFVSAPDASTAFSFELTDTTTNSVMVQFDGSVSITVFKLRLYIGGFQGSDATLSVAIGSGITVGTWYTLAISQDGTTITAWLDGVSVATRTDTANFPAAAAVMAVNHTAGAGAKKLECDAMAIAFQRGP